MAGIVDTSLIAHDGGPESVFRSVADAEVSLDEMLSLACRQGKQDIVELLLESGAKVNYRNKAGNTPLLEACSQGHVTIAHLLLERNADIDAPTETTSDSALTWACTLGNEEIVQLLLEHKSAIEHRTRDGCTALMFAALAGHDKVARLLLDHGAQLNVASDSNKDSPLTFACWKGHQKVVELFLTHNADIEHRTKEGFSPLMFAALGGHTGVARLLLEKDAEVNNPSGSNNDIPLTSACWKGHHAVVELLLQYKSNIEHHTKDGCTPLMLAAREGHLSVAQLLLDNNAKVNVASGSENNIPLTLACWKGHKDVVELLLRYHSCIEHQNKAGCTPLMLAAREGHYEATELLLDHDAQINVPSGSNDDTPLTLACWKGHENVVALLLERQSNINHQTKTGCTPLMEATREGHVGVARMLLEAGADVETPDNYGQTPFFMACWKGHAEVSSLLLDYGANKDCRTKTGITPFFQACRENHVEVVKLLLDYGCNSSAPFPNSRECPLTLAAEKGYVELTQLLISRSANVECRTKKGCSPLFLACKEGYKEISVMLAKHGADTEATDQRGVTPLCASLRNGHVEVVEWLLGHVAHLPSELECHKARLAPKPSENHGDIQSQRAKCLELIMKAKKAREQAALKNAQILFEELDAEKEKKETKRKAAARKRSKRKAKKKKEQAERQKDDEDEEDDDDGDEEEVKADKPQPEPMETAPDVIVAVATDTMPMESKEELSSLPFQEKRRKRKKIDSSIPMSITSNSRTSPQTPAATENWDEESGDEYVDAPSEFIQRDPEEHPPSDKKRSPQATPKSLLTREKSQDNSRSSNGKAKAVAKNSSKGKPPVAKEALPTKANGPILSAPPSKRGASKSVSSSGKNSHSSLETEGFSRNSGKAKDRGHHGNQSPDPKKPWSGHGSKDGPLLLQRPSSAGSLGHGSSEDNQEEPWDSHHEDEKEEDQGFKPANRRNYHAVTTVAMVTTAVTTTTSSSSSYISSRAWQEVSRAIKTFQMTVSNSLVGRIIGRKGSKINQIQADSGAQISISRAIPRSIERLITIKGTERSVNMARELIDEALSTPSKESDGPPPTELPPAPPIQSHANTAATTASTSGRTQSHPPPVSAWKQKRYSDVVPPIVAKPPGPKTGADEVPVSSSVSARRISLPLSIPSTSTNVLISDSKSALPAESKAPAVTTATVALVPNAEARKSPSLSPPPSQPSTSDPPPHIVVTMATTTSHSLPEVNCTSSLPAVGPLTMVTEETSEYEVMKEERSNSDPIPVVLINDRISPIVATPSPVSQGYSPSGPHSASPTGEESVDAAEEIENSNDKTQDVNPSRSITVTSSFVTRAVGVVAPTQAVKPVQRDTLLSTTVTPTVTTVNETPPPTPGMGNFGAIGPPSRRSSLPITTTNHYNSNPPIDGFRKLSYAGIPMVQHVNAPLGMVPEMQAISREYSWPGSQPHPPNLDNNWGRNVNNHGDHNDQWSSDYERSRSLSWAGLPIPPNTNNPYPIRPDTYHHVNNVQTPWGKFQPPPGPYSNNQSFQQRPPYQPHPPVISQMNNPPGNYSNGGFNNREPVGSIPGNHLMGGMRYPPANINKAPPTQSMGDLSMLSLRQVLGENLEHEIFTSEGNGLEPHKDDSQPKRWSVSSFPPREAGGGTWSNPTHGPHIHTSFPSQPPQSDTPLISDLASSWPIWTSPSSAHQPRSPFSPTGIPTKASDTKGWAGGGNSSDFDLVKLMKQLDIAEHIPVLKTRQLSLEQLCNMTEDEWRDLNLPVGPRVKLMNALNKFDKSAGAPPSKLPAVTSQDSNYPSSQGVGQGITQPPKYSPFVQ